MHVVFVGGTGFLGPHAVRLAVGAGHRVTVAHSGEHEADLPAEVAHIHARRDTLLAPGGPVETSAPQVIVDPFPGAATAAKAEQVVECARRCGARLVAISSVDVYQYLIQAGLGDGSGKTLLASQTLPITEDAELRTCPYPGAKDQHDNAAAERVLRDSGLSVTALRPGAIYGPGDRLRREWSIVARIKTGARQLPLPDGGHQLFHRVAVERVARAVLAAVERDPGGYWACNVVDPYQWTYAGLAGEIGRLLDWTWDPQVVPFDQAGHPWQVWSPVVCCDRRLREVLGVTEPDPRAALEECVRWLWELAPPSAGSPE
jgi:nucleoside-diphosphate-sugar epimerase